MGARLAALLTDALEGHDVGTGTFPGGAAIAEDERDTFTGLMEAAATDAPPEDVFRRLVEATGADVDRALTAAQDDGMLFEGSEWVPDKPVREILEARLTEAADQTGVTPGTRRYNVVVIRPGEGKGTGLRIYTQNMLRENAENFGGQPIFFNHESLEEMLKRGHGSRDPRDLAGYLQEATAWDPDYTEPDDKKNGWEQGAVKGTAEFLVEAADYIDRLPKAVKLSINMAPTKLKAQRRKDKKLGALVEGVVKGSGSVDLITGDAGAGGRVLDRLREAAIARYSGAHDVLATALGNQDALGRLVEALAQPVAQRLGTHTPTEDDVTDIDVSKLSAEERAQLTRDLFNTPEAQGQLVEALASSDAVDRLVEAKVAEREDTIREEVRGDSDRLLDLRDFRDEAHRLIEAAGRDRGGILTPAFQEDLRERFMLRDGRTPTPALDVADRANADGTTTPALDVLRESVATAIEREQSKLREAAPTRVRGLGPGEPAPGEGGGEGGEGGGEGGGERKRVDPMADRLKLDPEQVAKNRNRGGR